MYPQKTQNTRSFSVIDTTSALFAFFTAIQQSLYLSLDQREKISAEKVYPNLQIEFDISKQPEDTRVKFATDLLVAGTDIGVDGVDTKPETNLLEGAVFEQ